MIPFLSRILVDYESLREYEETSYEMPKVAVGQVLRRLVALERQENPRRSDSFYNGYSQMVYDDEPCQTMVDLMVGLPNYWADRLLIRQKNLTYVNAEYFKTWMSLIGRIPPLWLLAAQRLDEFDTEQLKNSTDALRMIERMNLIQFQYSAQPVPYIPDLHYYVESGGGLDDLHIHLNGSTETDVIWMYMIRHPYRVAMEFAKSYRNKESVRKLSEQVMPGITPSKLLTRLSDAYQMRNIMWRVACNVAGINKPRLPHGTTSLTWELLFYLMVMKVIERNSNQLLAGMLHHYLLIKGMVHKFLVMQQSQVGFSQFQMITANSLRDDVERKYENRFKQLAGCAGIPFLRVVEGRFSPRSSSLENRLYVSQIVDGFDKAKASFPQLLEHTELRLIAHFIKRSDNHKGVRHQSLRVELKRKACALYSFVKRSNDRIGHSVCGVDAAASEFDARPEVFAAAFKYLRGKGLQHFTFHAGEDFHHLLSGLRTIYEAIEFLDLKSGDRLGHCTAVGILPRLWRKRVGKCCYIPAGEWLDDLVFVWAMISESKNDNLQSIVLKLESEISNLSMRVYGSCRHPSEIWDSLLMRKDCPIPELNEYQVSALGTPATRRKCLITKVQDRLGYELWLAYNQVDKQLMPLRHSREREQYDKIMKVPTDYLFSDSNYEELQNIILHCMAIHNIVIEVLPTSNMRISYYEKLREYHLKRWLNVEGESCMMPSVVLGTDDPGIFMTNIFNEYATVYQHLAENNYSPMKRVEVIANLQKFSEIYRF